MELMALGLLLKPAMLSGREMRFLRKACRFNQEELARRLGITRRAVIEREKKPTPGLKADQELGLRVVLAGGFKTRLDRDGTHLRSKHLKQLDGILQHFADFAEELETEAKRERTTLTRDQRSWRFTEPDTLAA
jgi:DNA-binding XRE family transcriptional regulator